MGAKNTIDFSHRVLTHNESNLNKRSNLTLCDLQIELPPLRSFNINKYKSTSTIFS